MGAISKQENKRSCIVLKVRDNDWEKWGRNNMERRNRSVCDTVVRRGGIDLCQPETRGPLTQSGRVR